MSNYHAIATVTEVLISMLDENLKNLFAGITITAKPPDVIGQEEPKTLLNLFLYQVIPNPGYHNFDLPSRDSKGELVRSASLGLNLFYLLTPYTSHNDSTQDIQPQQVLAKALMVLHETPTLDRKKILKVRQDSTKILDKKAVDHLENQIELVKINPVSLSIDEMSKLWSSCFQIHYRPSVVYHASVILLESEKQTRPGLRVQERKVYVLPLMRPVIERIEPQIIELADDAIIRLIGHNLLANNITISVGRSKENMILLVPEPLNAFDNEIRLRVPQELSAGINQVQVIHPLVIGEPEVEHSNWKTSNIGAFVLAPRITNPSSKITISKGSFLTLSVKPGVTESQKVQVLLGHHVIDIPLPPAAAPDDYPKETLPKFQIPLDFPVNGTSESFVLRLRVDGSDSLVKLDNDPDSQTFNEYLPAVEILQ
jgi:hypothetical protein